VANRGFPEGAAPKPQHIRAAIIAYAAGDALGVPWEGKTPDQVPWEALEELPARGDWPQGSTSDDTEQLLLVAQYLVQANGQAGGRLRRPSSAGRTAASCSSPTWVRHGRSPEPVSCATRGCQAAEHCFPS
jgi:ADP-ribosylglycohydrolase